MSEPSRQPGPNPQTSFSAAPGGRPLWTLIGPGLGVLFVGCQCAGLLVLGEPVQRDLGSSTALTLAAIVAHLIAAAAGAAAGYLLGRRAPTAVLVPALLLMLIAAVVTATAGTPLLAIAATVVAGLGGGAVLGTAAALAGQTGRRGQVLAAIGLAGFAGLVLGALLGWFLSSSLGWRPTYLFMVPMILAALIATAATGVVAMVRRNR